MNKVLMGLLKPFPKLKNTSVEGLSHAGFLEARSGKSTPSTPR